MHHQPYRSSTGRNWIQRRTQASNCYQPDEEQWYVVVGQFELEVVVTIWSYEDLQQKQKQKQHQQQQVDDRRTYRLSRKDGIDNFGSQQNWVNSIRIGCLLLLWRCCSCCAIGCLIICLCCGIAGPSSTGYPPTMNNGNKDKAPQHNVENGVIQTHSVPLVCGLWRLCVVRVLLLLL